MSFHSIHVIVSPFHVGVKDHRAGAGPKYILNRGLVKALEQNGSTVSVEYIEDVDDHEGEIGRSFEVLRRVSKAVSSARQAGAFPVVLSGNCNNTVGVVAGLEAHHADLVWFDAHPDFDTPDEVTSGYFDVNGVAILAGQGWKALAATVPGHRPIDLSKFTYVGLRDFERENQKDKIKSSGVGVVWGGEEKPHDGFASDLAKKLDGRKESPCVVHFDVDSLDTSVGIANHAAAPGGLTKEDAVSCIRAIKEHRKPVSMTVASFDPSFEGADGIADAAIAAILEMVN